MTGKESGVEVAERKRCYNPTLPLASGGKEGVQRIVVTESFPKKYECAATRRAWSLQC